MNSLVTCVTPEEGNCSVVKHGVENAPDPSSGNLNALVLEVAKKVTTETSLEEDLTASYGHMNSNVGHEDAR